MKSIESPLKNFLKPWQKKEGYLGAILTGSYATGTQTEFSDVDVQIVYDDNVSWRERGNKMIDGYLFEYFANPIPQYKKYMEKEFLSGKRTTARMFVTGKIIEDPTGQVSRLKKEAATIFKRKLRPMSKIDIEIAKYSIWDALDGLKDLATKQTPDSSVQYGISLGKILGYYTKFLKVEGPTSSKMFRFLSEKSFRDKYQMPQLPDPKFVKLFLAAITKQDIKEIEKVAKYVQLKMGGFDIDGWKLKTPTEK